MQRFETQAVDLAQQAIEALDLQEELALVTHMVVASCTGFTAPGLDQQIMERLGLNPSIERTMVGFMGCAAAVNALKVAHHIVGRAVRQGSGRQSGTLHAPPSGDLDLEVILSALLFGDGCAASLVSAEPEGIALKDFRVATIPDTRDHHMAHRRCRVRDEPVRGGSPADHESPSPRPPAMTIAVSSRTAQGRFRPLGSPCRRGTILDAVEQDLDLGPEALRWSRGVLRDFGNMSSATLMFVLGRIMQDAPPSSNRFGGIRPGTGGRNFPLHPCLIEATMGRSFAERSPKRNGWTPSPSASTITVPA